MNVRPRILLLGASGQVGWELRRSLSVVGDILAVGRNAGRGESFDLTDLDGLAALLDRHAPDVIVNAAAYTAVDKAESERDKAFILNAFVPGLLGRWAAEHGALVLHYSTDYVFDGSKDGTYNEDDLPAPLNVYGESKLAGDMALLQSGAQAWIFRVSWVYGLRRHNFLLTMRRLMQERDGLDIVRDQFGAPTWCRSIAESSSCVLIQLLCDPSLRHDSAGVYHLAPQGDTSWYGFAGEIRKLLGLGCELTGIATEDYPTPARRPSNSRMDATRLREVFNIALPKWQDSLRDCLEQ